MLLPYKGPKQAPVFSSVSDAISNAVHHRNGGASG
jgi:hypothetical protein